MDTRDLEVYEEMARKELGKCIIIDSYSGLEEEFEENVLHPLLLSDVLEYMKREFRSRDTKVTAKELLDLKNEMENLLSYWRMQFPTYDEQSEECKAFIHSLCSNKWTK